VYNISTFNIKAFVLMKHINLTFPSIPLKSCNA